ncbi:dolichyl-phosphate-mannose-protein mannosyltransferase [Chitinophaga skermanii]|uniref:Dolichyl-phosphate-mannose-protein mannosyltransferase n=1 Tax=Chitinophaga skermanii TaxID=331697 RepID=A0A327QNB5_9BACT|nr:glycosyltransferase family 39 protein [Chitinophaga skermanii]RAJ05184.1 dolichyl-phosphate-mannose-protein mannosyltransferase [Chitinophaga skermanii]
MKPSQRSLYIIIFVACLVKLLVHIGADIRAGFHGDEFLHIATGNHLAWGYMEFPPMIGWLAYLQNLSGSTAVWVHHIFPHIAMVAIYVVVGLTAIRLGIQQRGLILLYLGLFSAPGFSINHQLFQPVVFIHLAWIVGFYQLAGFVKTLQPKYLLYLAITAGLGMLTKYDMLFFLAGLSGLLFFQSTRNVLLQPKSWQYILVALLIFLPNYIWQLQHHFPVVQHMARLYEKQLSLVNSSNVAKEVFIAMNPIAAIMWIGGVLLVFIEKDRIIRTLGLCIFISIVLLDYKQGKEYYFFPAMMCLFILGALWMEKYVLPKAKWAFYPISGLFAVSAAGFTLIVMSFLPVEKYVALVGIKKKEVDRYPVRFADIYSKDMWHHIMLDLKSVYDSLPPQEKSTALIWGKHYSQAGAVELYKKEYQLPGAISYHGSFYLWAPTTGTMPPTVIAYNKGDAGKDFWDGYYKDVQLVKTYHNKYARDPEDEYITIYVCKQPLQDYARMKELFANRVYE